MHAPNVNLGAGWVLRHVTDRTVFLVKEDWAYRQLTGRDGYVLIRGEPEATMKDILNDAWIMAEANDERLGLILGEKLLPADWKIRERASKYQDGDIVVSAGGSKVVSVAKHREIQAVLAGAFATPQDPQVKIYRP